MGTAPDDTRTAMVARTIRDRIDARALTPGARLPSIRAMAVASGVAPSTVVEAYDRLTAEGVIRSRPGSGFYVAAPLAPLTLDRLTSGLLRSLHNDVTLRSVFGGARCDGRSRGATRCWSSRRIVAPRANEPGGLRTTLVWISIPKDTAQSRLNADRRDAPERASALRSHA